MKNKVFIIGVGKMGMAHIKVFKDLNPEKLGAWAPSDRAKLQIEKKGLDFFHTDLEIALNNFLPTHVVIAAPMEELFNILLKSSGTRESPIAAS